jgi:hypothetical protein
MSRQNCWEFKNCGRQPGGAKAAELGVCVAASEGRVDGLNDGRNGGRACWAIAGTLCGGVVQGSFAAKLTNCMKCEFFLAVNREQGAALASPRQILERLA